MSDTFVYLLPGAWAFGGFIGINFWRLLRHPRRPPDQQLDPTGWLHYYLPVYVVIETWALGEAVLLKLVSDFNFSWVSLAVVTLLCAAFDAAVIRSARHVARRQRAAGNDGPHS